MRPSKDVYTAACRQSLKCHSLKKKCNNWAHHLATVSPPYQVDKAQLWFLRTGRYAQRRLKRKHKLVQQTAGARGCNFYPYPYIQP